MCAPPAIPFLAFLQSDLVFIEDGNPSTVKSTEAVADDGAPLKLINFRKHTQQSSVLRYVQRFQRTPYTFTELPALAACIDVDIRSRAESANDDELYDLSLTIEPRS